MNNEAIRAINSIEIEAVSGAGEVAYWAAYIYARSKGWSHEAADAAGDLASAVDDALTSE